MISALYYSPNIGCLHSLADLVHLWAIYFAFTRVCLVGKMIINDRLRLAKVIFAIIINPIEVTFYLASETE